MAWTALVTNVRWGSESPAIYFDLYYDSYRSVNSMYYKTKISIHACSSPFAEEIYVKFYLDNTLKLNNHNIKAYTPTTWASPIEYESSWYEVPNKLNGTTKLDYWLFSDNRLYNYIYYLPVLGSGSVLGTVSNFTVDTAYGTGNAFAVPCTKYDASYYDVLYVYIGSNLVATRNNYMTGNFTFTEAELTTPYTGVYALMGGSLSKEFTFNLVTFVDSNKATQVGNGSVKYATGTVTNYGSTLNAIPYFTLDTTEGVGNPFTVSVNKPTSTTYDVLTVKIGANTVATRDNYLSGTVTFSNAEITTATTGIYALMPSSRFATFTFELKSYTDSGKGTQVGTTSTKTTTGSISAYVPTINSANITHLDSNTTTVALTGSNQKFIQGHSNLQITVSSKATTYRGATLGNNAYGFMVSGATTQYANESDSLNFVKTFNDINIGSYGLYIVDNRSCGVIYNKGLSFTAYSDPVISSLSITRLNGSSASIYIALSGTYTNWTGLSTTNSIQTSRFRYKEVGGVYGSYTDIALTTNTGGSYTKSSYNAVNLDITKDYEFEVEIIDQLESVTQTVLVPAGTGTLSLDIANKSLGVGKIPDASVDRGSLDIAGSLYFDAVQTFGVQVRETTDTIDSPQFVRLVEDKVRSLYGIGDPTVVSGSITSYLSTCQIDTNKYFIVYSQSSESNIGRVLVATVDGTEVSLGDPTTFNNAATTYISITKIDTNKALVCYRQPSTGCANAISLSGSTITVGNQVTYESGDVSYVSTCTIDTNKALVCYRDLGNSNQGTSCAMTVSTVTITAGSPVVFETGSTSDIAVCKLDTDKALVIYTDAGNTNKTTGAILTVSTRTITANASAVFDTYTTSGKALCQITTNQALFSYYRASGGDANSYTGVITASGTSFSAGSLTTLASTNMYKQRLAPFDSTRYLLMYVKTDDSSYDIMTCLLTVNSTTVTDDYPIKISAGNNGEQAVAQMESGKCVLVYRQSAPYYCHTSVYSSMDADGYALLGEFNSGTISGRVDSVNVVPYIPLN